MVLRSLGRVLVVIGVALGGCAFEPSGGPDASVVDFDAPLDGCVPQAERCNGLDDDCDENTDEAFPTLGGPCDGPDIDACPDDLLACNAAGDGTACVNLAPDDDVETCNGLNDDCDGATDEAFPTLGQGCDGPDGDLCNEGGFVCNPAGTGVDCDDMTATNVELCNGVNDDCDATTDEGFNLTNDIQNCGMCGRHCTNGFGTTTCAASMCTPTCTAGAHDCDGNPITGCEPRNTDPVCTAATAIGTVSGDTGADTINRTGYGEAFFRVTVSEADFATISALEAQVTLTSPPGVDFDLFVRCGNCGGNLESSNSTGVDTVNIGRGDFVGPSNYDLFIEVRWYGSLQCGNWSLVVTGNVSTANRACD